MSAYTTRQFLPYGRPQEAGCFVERVFHNMVPESQERMAFLFRFQGSRAVVTRYAPPGELHSLVLTWKMDVYFSVATFIGSREEAHATSVKTLWADIDPPSGLGSSGLRAWQGEALSRLQDFEPLPTIIVFSGRGYHAYWLLDEVLRLKADAGETVYMVKAANRRLSELLSSDAVSDLARTLRLPGTTNSKTGRVCRVVVADGPTYRFSDLLSKIGLSHGGLTEQFQRESLQTPPTRTCLVEARTRRVRGRPPLGVTKRDLRDLKPRDRELVTGGPWTRGSQYLFAARIDRSRADMAAVGAMVRAGWSEEMVLAAFSRGDWLIGTRFRELQKKDGHKRAVDYLRRTIARARFSGGRSAE